MNNLQTDLIKELQDNYLLYSYSTFNRAIPSCVDGLKTAQRRILLGLKDLNLSPNGAFKKVSRLEGHVLGSYHPQGGCSGTAINMGQMDTFRYPLTNIHGNVGGSIQSGNGIGKTISEDPPAAARYLEIKSTEITQDIYLNHLNYHSHKWIDNYDGSTKEVQYFIPSLPMLLINGGTGIATGYACNHVSYNINEVINSLIAWIKNKNISIEQLMKKNLLLGPDLPNGARIVDENLKEIISLGCGSLKVCGTWDFKSIPWGKKSKRDALIVTSLGLGSSEKFLEKLKKAIEEEKISGIQDVSDLSSREGIEIMVILKNGIDKKEVLSGLLQYTNLFDTINVNATALKTLGENCEFPRQMGFLEIISNWFEARKISLIDKFKYDKSQAEHKLEIIQGYIILSDNIDKAIKLIRSSDDNLEAKNKLIQAFKLSEIQANAILGLPLNKLVKTEKDKLLLEEQYLKDNIIELNDLIENDSQLEKYILKELNQIKKQFKDERRSEIISSSEIKICSIKNKSKNNSSKKVYSLKDQIKDEGRRLKIPLKIINEFLNTTIKNGKSIRNEWKNFSQRYYQFNIPEGKRQRRSRLEYLKQKAKEAGMPSRGKNAWNAFLENRKENLISDIEHDLKKLYKNISIDK